MAQAVLKCGDSLATLKSILKGTVSAIICDPPYTIEIGGAQVGYRQVP